MPPLTASNDDERRPLPPSDDKRQLEDFTDGFSPVGLGPRVHSRLLRPHQPAVLPAGLTVLPEAICEAVAREAYEFTQRRPHEDPGQQQWGTYLQVDGEDEEEGSGELKLRLRGAEPEVETLAARLLQDFYKSTRALLRPDLPRVHGFSVWAVVGGPSKETAYHVDYAELYRRRTNIIVPPLHAATLQVSPVRAGEVEGGTFGAHTDGLSHYQRFGFKAQRDPKKKEARQSLKPTSDWGVDQGWTYAPYTFRQATLCSGELPHAADRVRKWPASMARVVVGINSCGFVEGPTELACPQHSAEFRMLLKLELLCRKVGSKEGVAKMLLEHVRRKKRNQGASAASDAPSTADAAPTAALPPRRPDGPKDHRAADSGCGSESGASSCAERFLAHERAVRDRGLVVDISGSEGEAGAENTPPQDGAV